MNENEIPDPQITPQKRLRKSQLTHSRPLGDCVTLGIINIKWIINLPAWREIFPFRLGLKTDSLLVLNFGTSWEFYEDAELGLGVPGSPPDIQPLTPSPRHQSLTDQSRFSFFVVALGFHHHGQHPVDQVT